jgi:hypothetical protein
MNHRKKIPVDTRDHSSASHATTPTSLGTRTIASGGSGSRRVKDLVAGIAGVARSDGGRGQRAREHGRNRHVHHCHGRRHRRSDLGARTVAAVRRAVLLSIRAVAINRTRDGFAGDEFHDQFGEPARHESDKGRDDDREPRSRDGSPSCPPPHRGRSLCRAKASRTARSSVGLSRR